jgi:3-oxoacyl-[acyl-carrier-protein] synthase II
MEQRCGIRRIEAFDASGFCSPYGGELPDFQTRDYVPKPFRKSVKVMSRDIEMAVVAAYEAVKDAKLATRCMVEREEADGFSPIDPTRFGVNIGAGLISPDINELGSAYVTAATEDKRLDYAKWGNDGMTNLTPLWLLKFLPNMLACHVTIVHDAQAPSNTITCGEASSHLAIGESFRMIARGDVDVCICGGVEGKICSMGLIRPQLLNRIAVGDDPSKLCKPFSKYRSGMVASEGGGLVILESLDHAKARNARIYAELAGFGATSDNNDWRNMDASGEPIALAMKNALADGGAEGTTVDLIGTFGPGTVEHDASELAGINRCFGESAANIHAIACKGAMGNNGAGSGTIDFAMAVLALHRNTVPPSPNTEDPDPACPLKFAPKDPIDAPIQSAMSIGYAMGGGQTAALFIKKYEE